MVQGESSGVQTEVAQLVDAHQRVAVRTDWAITTGDQLYAYQLVEELLDLRDWITVNSSPEVSIDTSYNTASKLNRFLTSVNSSGQGELAEKIAAKRLRKTGDPYEAHGIYLWAAGVHAIRDDLNTSQSLLKSSLEVAEDISSPWLKAVSHARLSQIAHKMGGANVELGEAKAALESIEDSESSDLYYPERGRVNANYAAKGTAMNYMAGLDNEDRFRQLRHDSMLMVADSGDLSRRAIYHFWMGVAEARTTPMTYKSNLRELILPLFHFTDAEFLFSRSSEHVFAGHAVLQRALLTGFILPGLADAKDYRRIAFNQWLDLHSPELGRQIVNLDRRIARVTRLFYSGSMAGRSSINPMLN